MRTSLNAEIFPTVAIAAVALAAALVIASNNPANANQEQPAATESSATVRYFIDFRARQGHLLGHTIVVYGKLNERGRPIEVHHAGLYPIDNQSGLIVGSVLPVDASVRAVKGDLTEPVTAVYGLQLTAAQYRIVTNAVLREKARETYWQMFIFNCNDFAQRIAASIGLRTPSTLLLPRQFVTIMKAMNRN